MFKKFYQRLKHQIPLVILTILITLCFLLEKINLYDWSILDDAENFFYDLRIIATMPNDVDERIVIVDIDERSLSEIGRWPWSRNNITRLVNELFDYYEVTLTGFDIVFAEPDESSGLKILKVLGRNELSGVEEYQTVINAIEEELNYDLQLSKSMSKHNIVLGYYFKQGQSLNHSTDAGILPDPAFEPNIFEGINVFAHRATGYGGNINLLQDAARFAGHFSPWIDDDGVIRRIPMIYEYEDSYYEALSLVMVKKLFDIKQTIPVFEQVDKSILQGAIVLVGTTAPGLFDPRTAPVQKQYPGLNFMPT